MVSEANAVIMEYLATDYPEPLSTLLYTSDLAQRNEILPTSEKVFMFPDRFTLQDIVTASQRVLRAAGVQFVMEPENIDETIEQVRLEYKPKENPGSDYFYNIFIPLLYGALGTIIKQHEGVEVSAPQSQD